MNIIVWTGRGGSYQLNLRQPLTLAAVSGGALTLLGAIFLSAVFAARALYYETPEQQSLRWKAELQEQRERLDRATREADERLAALGVQLGEMNAQVIRLNALGERLTRMAGLDEGEFNFDSPPARGGPEDHSDGLDVEPLSSSDFLGSLHDLADEIRDREQQLGVLEKLLMNRNVQERVRPQGRPVRGGWISSGYGSRTDPFSGRRAWHGGIDFAGREGSDVSAVAAGVVTWSGRRYGYGNLVEINHGNGYVTRYAHNQKNVVEVGDTVKKGQLIAKLGSTGRATGPHVHFEVLYNGRTVNPSEYIRGAN
jgi:murein DD-endopeptidase MepM/ murein hydrolase activator NlpD